MTLLARRVLAGIATIAELLAIAALVVDLVVTFTNTLLRYLLNSGIDWADDASSICVAIMAFVGAAAAYRRSRGLAYTAVIERVPAVLGAAMSAAGIWAVIAVCVTSLVGYPTFFRLQQTQTMPVLDLNNGYQSAWLGIGLVLMAAFAFERLAACRPKSILAGAIILIVTAGSLVLFKHALLGRTDTFIPVAAAMVVAFVVAVPVPYVLAVGGLGFLAITGEPTLVAVPAAYQAGIGSFVLLAIPFFLIGGLLMEATGMAGRLIHSVQLWIGHVRGGLLIAQVVAMYIFSGMSGSKAADVATVGSVMKGSLRAHGYRPTESVAVLAASAAMGEVIPPSLALLILGSITSLSVGTLFIAGVVPAALLAATLIVAVRLRGRDGAFPKGEPFSLGDAIRSLPGTIPAVLVPVIVIGGIIGGIASPTEASSFAVVYTLFAAFLFYRATDLKTLWTAVREGTLTAGTLLFMLGTSNLLSQAIVIDGLAGKLSALATSTASPTVFLVVSMIAIIVLGFVLEGFPAILISAPILLPIAEHFGIDPLQYGILLVMAVGIGVFLPPVGIGYYVACSIGEAPPHETMRPAVIYNVFLLAGLVVAMFIPGITLALPHFFGLH